MDSVNSAIIRGVSSVISLIFSLIIAALVVLAFFGYKKGIPAWLLIVHALLVVVTIATNKNYRHIIQEACNSFFRPLPQLFQLIIIAPISIILSTKLVAEVIPANPYIMKNAQLVGIILTGAFLWVLVLYIMLLGLHMYVGLHVMTKLDEKRIKSWFTHISIFIGLLLALSISYKVFISTVLDTLATKSKALIIYSQFHKNYQCPDIDKSEYITFIGPDKVLVVKGNGFNKFEFEKESCDLNE